MKKNKNLNKKEKRGECFKLMAYLKKLKKITLLI